jgi:hypothetical protein
MKNAAQGGVTTSAEQRGRIAPAALHQKSYGLAA